MPFVLTYSAPRLPQVPQLQGNKQCLELRLRYCHLPTWSCFMKKGRRLKSSLPILRVQHLLPLSPAYAHSPRALQTPKDFHHLSIQTHPCKLKQNPSALMRKKTSYCRRLTKETGRKELSSGLAGDSRIRPKQWDVCSAAGRPLEH